MATTTAIPIPSRKNKHPAASNNNDAGSVDSAASTPPGSYGSATPSGSPSSENTQSKQRRRESLMSAAFSAQEHTVVNVGDAESPRLVRLTCPNLPLSIQSLLPFPFEHTYTTDIDNTSRYEVASGLEANTFSPDNMRQSLPRLHLEPRNLPPELRGLRV